ncbi:hypothetical protein E2C01_079145 [Portunus trituberculatus]|uniref:Uncharacterized protein n=2 Tax=Portunus trituberculatus TaxID=210409 RepID=A0A5B7ISI4_PORTR|nr:hypothetical protein [Portunus trituberculatus]
MWRGGQGGVGLAPCSATEGELGAAGTGTTTTTTIDKSHYDSQNDSGFLSGSNLTSCSSCSVGDDTDTMRFSEPLPPPGDTKGDTHAHSSRVDSGIDISEQLSSLHLASSSTSTTTTSTSELEGEDAPQRRTVTPPPRRSRLGLSEEQMALLQEIFKRDEDGDT